MRLMIALLATLNLSWALNLLLVLAVLALFVVGARWLFGKAGWSLPEPIWGIIGFIVLILVILWAMGGGTFLR